MTFAEYSKMTTPNEEASNKDDVILTIQDAEILEQPRTYLVWSLFNSLCCLLCCCNWFSLPFSIPALIYSLKARENIRMGNIKRAIANSRISRFLNLIVLITVISLIIAIVVAFEILKIVVRNIERNSSRFP